MVENFHYLGLLDYRGYNNKKDGEREDELKDCGGLCGVRTSCGSPRLLAVYQIAITIVKFEKNVTRNSLDSRFYQDTRQNPTG